ncbi:unnamed protein product [Prunus armeniaca]
MDEDNSVPMMMEVNQGVEEGFASNQPSPMTESTPAIVTSEAQTSAFNQLPPLPSQKKRKLTRKPSEETKYFKTADYKYDPATCGTSSLRTNITNL